jgi:hypothetical protein
VKVSTPLIRSTRWAFSRWHWAQRSRVIRGAIQPSVSAGRSDGLNRNRPLSDTETAARPNPVRSYAVIKRADNLRPGDEARIRGEWVNVTGVAPDARDGGRTLSIKAGRAIVARLGPGDLVEVRDST